MPVISVEIRLGCIFGLTPPPNLGRVLHNSCLEIQSQIQSVLAIIVQLNKNAAHFEIYIQPSRISTEISMPVFPKELGVSHVPETK